MEEGEVSGRTLSITNIDTPNLNVYLQWKAHDGDINKQSAIR